MSEHPSPFDLESYREDPSNTEVGAHLETCEQCQTYLTDPKKQRAPSLENQSGNTFEEQPKNVVAGSKAGPENAPIPRWKSLLKQYAGPAAVVLAAALVIVFILPPKDELERTGPPTKEASVEDITSKAKSQLSLILQRRGKQSKHNTTLDVQQYDQIRLELTVLEPDQFTVGVLKDNGQWHSLMEGKHYETGIHLVSKDGFVIDDQPTRAWAIAGSPEAVKNAIKTRVFKHVFVVQIQPKDTL